MPDIYDQLLDETPDQQAVPVAAAGDTSAPDVYDVLLNEFQEGQQQRMQASLDAALSIAPEQAADAERLAKASGLPLAVVERNLDAVQKQVQLREVQSMLADSPILSRQMQDPQFAALAHKDIKNLGMVERTARGFSGGMTEMVGRTLSGLGELGDIFQRNTLNMLSAALLPEPRHGSKSEIDADSLYGPMIGEGWRGAGTLAKDFARDDLMIPSAQQTFYDHVAGGLGQVTGQILMHLATGGVASVPSMYAQGADIMAEAVADDDAEQWRKDLAILGGGAVTAVTEKWALDRIMGPLAVPVKNKIGAALLRVGIAGASEGAQEMAEGIMHDALRVYLTNPEAGFDFAENLYEGGVGATVGTIARSFVEAALHVRTRGARRQQEAEEAEKNAELMEDLHKLAQASELLQTSPETFEQFIAEATEDGPVQDIYIDANFLMQSGLAEQVAELSPSVAEQIETAAATGGTVQVPLAEYARTIAPTEYAQQLLDHLKTEPQGFSRAEARAYMQNEAQELEAELEQMLGGEEEQLEFKASQDKVRQVVLDNLNEGGRFTPEVNEVYASLIAARAGVRAMQRGVSPEAQFQQEMLRVQSAPIAGAHFDQADTTTPDAADSPSVEEAPPEPQARYLVDGEPVFSGEPDWTVPEQVAVHLAATEGLDAARAAVAVYEADDSITNSAWVEQFAQAVESLDGREVAREAHEAQAPSRPLPEGYDPERNLYVAHNLSAENILAADELGGLAAPSIAVGRTDIGFDDFGEVTLLADPQLLLDKKIRTFDADVYSPRQPRAHYDIDTAAFRAFTDTLDPDNLGLSQPDINELSGTDGADALLRSDAVRLKFLQERNKAPRLKNAKADPLVKRAAKLDTDRYSLQTDPKFVALAVRYYEGMVQKAEEGGRGERYRSMWFNEDGTLQSNSLRSFADHVRRFKETDGKDVDQLRNDLRAKFHNQKLSDEYQQWAADHFNTMVKGRQLFKGFTNAGNRRYIPYTLENVVKEMTQQLQAGEGSFYGAGSVRSAYANEMRTLDQIRERRGQIVSKEEFEKLRDESNAVLQDALEKLKPFYKYDADGWGYAEDAGSAIAEGPKGIREAFESAPEVRQIIGELTDYLRAMPTTYFEAKAQRAVQFSEFDTAVVPKGMRKDALQVLRDAGLKIKTYDRNVEGSREQVVTKQKKLLFQQKAQGARGAFDPEANIIALLKDADLSTFLHEAGHYFFESDISLAAEIVDLSRTFGEQTATEGELQILRDVSALFDWHGIQGTIQEQLDQWFNMDFEEKRVYHERTAESFERYLFEGKAPSIEMQPYFQKFRAWLTNVYRSLKDFLQRNPEAGKLSDEVRAVFDRMLATEDQIKLAEQGRSMMPLFRTEAEASNIGMTPEEFKAYQETDKDATTEAVQDLERKGLRDLQWLRNAHNREVRKLRKQASALRSEAQMEARREVMSQPVYRAWQFLTAKITDEDRLSPAERPKSDPDVLDPTQDDLLAAMAKLGGLNKEAAVAEWGVDPADRPSSGVFGKPVLRAKDSGLTIEEMAETLAEQGYIPRDEHGKYDIRELEDRFFAALRGETVYSDRVDASVLLEPVPGEGADLSQISAGRLDLGALREMGVDETSINLLKARRMTARDGIHPDLVGPQFQYPNGQTLVDALLEATPPREEIDALTETKMLERHGELASPEAIEREADRAIHNETRARMVTTEHNALAQASGGKKLMRQAAREFARHMVGRSKIRDLSPHKYTSAEVRAAKAAEAASRAGDIAKAATEKRNQLVNIYAAKAAMDARAEVDTSLRYLSKFNREGTRKNLDVEYLEQIDTILERFDLRAGQSLKAIDKRATLAKWVEGMEAEGLEPDIPDYIMAEANRTHYKNMTMEQFQGMVESIRQIEHLGRLKKKLLTAKDQRELDAIVEEMRERIEQSSGGRIVDNERRNTAKSWMGHVFRGALAAHRKAASVVREMDGFEEGGPVWERIIRPMNERGEWEVTMRADAAQRLHELAKPVLALGPMGGNGDYFATLGRSLNRGERLAIALNYGNDSNRQRLLGGRNWTDAQIQPVLSSLTATEWTFVQGVWEFFESYRPDIAAKERRVYGKEPDWIEPSPFTVQTADGQTMEIAGGYYPIKYDPRQSGKAGEFAEAEDAKAMMRAAYTAATTRRSFTKTRAEEVHGRPLLLTFDGIWQGANEVIHDLAWHEWLIDANRLVKRLDSTIRTHYGAEYVDVLRNTIKDVARGDIPAANTIEAALTHVRNGSSIVGMGWNLFTALLQPLGIANSIVRVGNGSNREGAKWIGKGMSQFYGSPRHMLDKVREVQGMSEFMANRARTMNREIADVRNRLETGKGDFQMKLEGTYFLLIQRMQELVDYPTWLGAYEKAIADPKNLNPDGTIDEARAVALADQAVIDSQSAGTIKDLAQVQRGHPAMKLFTNFYSYFSVLLNLSVEQGKIRVQRKDYAGLMSDYLILIVAPAVLSAVMREALRGQDDEDEYLKAIGSELVGYPFGMFVLGRELSTAAQLAAGVGNPAFGYSGPAGLRFFSEITKLGQQAGQGDLDMALFKAANNTAGILFHYPAGQVNRFVDGTAALIEGRTENPLAPLVGPPPQR